jgi:glycerophosphoryl diester phosphodiesterase
MSLRPLLLGHRGARAVKSIPENTIASFDRALADGCDGFEFDVRLTADGGAAVCHDPIFDGLEIKLAKAAELRLLPTLQEVIEKYKDSAFLDIELKVSGLERMTIEGLQHHKPNRGFVVSSFLPKVLQAVHAEDSSIPLGLICETKAELARWRELPVEFVIVHQKLAGKDSLREIMRAGRKIFVWTVNKPADMRRFVESGVHGIISDNTKLLCETVAR